MAEKFESILRQIHWSLLLRAAVFALAWYIAPFWLFLLIALYLYFKPLFNARRLFWPFFALLILAYLTPATLVYAIIFFVLFYYLLLIKDLLLIDRRSAYELLVLALSFFLLRSFYGGVGSDLMIGVSVWYGLFIAALFGLLVSSFIRYAAEDTSRDGESDGRVRSLRRIAAYLTFIIMWQFLFLGLFLPLDSVYQATIIFLASVLVIDLLPESVSATGVSQQRMLATGATVAALLILTIVSAKWGL